MKPHKLKSYIGNNKDGAIYVNSITTVACTVFCFTIACYGWIIQQKRFYWSVSKHISTILVTVVCAWSREKTPLAFLVLILYTVM